MSVWKTRNTATPKAFGVDNQRLSPQHDQLQTSNMLLLLPLIRSRQSQRPDLYSIENREEPEDYLSEEEITAGVKAVRRERRAREAGPISG